MVILLGLELSEPILDDSGYEIKFRVIPGRARLVITPVPGSNSTTVPEGGLLSSLNDKLSLALSAIPAEEGVSWTDGAMGIPIPEEIALDSLQDDGILSSLGLQSIGIGENGLAFQSDDRNNSIRLLVRTVISQSLHRDGNLIDQTQ